jgi:sugar phosphate isomerase/epimerase
MKRRAFLTTAAAAAASGLAAENKLEIGMHQATLWRCQSDLRQDYEAIAKAGFTAVEIFQRKVDRQKEYSLADVKSMLADNNLKLLGSQLAPSLGFPDDGLEKRTAMFQKNLDRTAELGLKISNCACIIREPKVTMDHFKQAVDNYRQAADLAKPYDIVIVIEFLKFSTFIGSLPAALWMTRQVNHPNLKVCLDAYHLWAGPSKIADLDDIRPGEVANFHIDDVKASKPREAMGDADRVMPGDGDIPLKEIVRRLSKNYNGTVMLELFSPVWWKRPVEEVCRVGYEKVQSVLAGV